MASFWLRAARRERERWATPPATAPAAAPAPALPDAPPMTAPAAAPRARDPLPATCGLAMAVGGGTAGLNPVCCLATAAQSTCAYAGGPPFCVNPDARIRLRHKAAERERNRVMGF